MSIPWAMVSPISITHIGLLSASSTVMLPSPRVMGGDTRADILSPLVFRNQG